MCQPLLDLSAAVVHSGAEFSLKAEADLCGETLGSLPEPLWTNLMLLPYKKTSAWYAEWKPRRCFYFFNAVKENKKNTVSLQPDCIKKALPLSCYRGKKDCFCHTDLALPPLSKWKKRIDHIWMKREKRGGFAWITHSCLRLTCQSQGNHGTWTLPLFIMCFVLWYISWGNIVVIGWRLGTSVILTYISKWQWKLSCVLEHLLLKVGDCNVIIFGCCRCTMFVVCFKLI